jgi:hypothetical protein
MTVGALQKRNYHIEHYSSRVDKVTDLSLVFSGFNFKPCIPQYHYSYLHFIIDEKFLEL